MKGRLIGALWIVGALALFYFAFDGAEFTAFFLFCLMVCVAEIVSISELRPYQLKPLACKPHGVWRLELSILFFAAFFCLLLTKQQLLLVVIVCHISDVGAFTCGKLLGKHKAKFTADISPNKTIEGFVGGIIATALAIPVCIILGIDFTPGVIAYLILSGAAAELGDLLGSATKRQLAIKDSGDGIRNMSVIGLLEYPIRGHGGYLDRLDSISLGIVLFALLNAPQA